MSQKFFTNTLESRYIKSILYNTFIPNYQSVSREDYIIDGKYYIYKNQIIKCTQSGFAGSTGRFQSLGRYEFGGLYTRLSSNFISKYSFYDSDTHERLGEYLRLYKNIKGVNLLPFYNCYSGKETHSLWLGQFSGESGDTTTPQVFSIPNNSSKVYRIPIKYNTKYTIAIDSNSSVWVAPALINNGALVNGYLGGDNPENLTSYLCQKGNIKHYSSLSFSQPIVYQVANRDEETAKYLENYKGYLYLLIQVDIENDSSLVVLEGDYTHTGTIPIINADAFDSLHTYEWNNILVSDLSLLRFNDKQQHPYSERLIEYLLNNVITKNDIYQNVEKTQTAIDFNTNDYRYFVPVDGLWSNKLRYYIYKYCMNDKKTIIKQDLNGYVDKDVEDLLAIKY